MAPTNTTKTRDRKLAEQLLSACRKELGIAADDGFEPVHYRLAIEVWGRFAQGMAHELWLYANRDKIRGRVLDVASHRFLHRKIHELPGVQEVRICAMEPELVYNLERFGAGTFRTPVDYVQDLTEDELTIPLNHFDTIICTSVLEHCQDPMKLLQNCHRLLKPDGYLLVFVPHVTAPHGPVDLWRFTTMGLEHLACRAGFRRERVTTGGLLNFDEEWATRFGEPPTPQIFSAGREVATGKVGIPLTNYAICHKV